jgi:mycothione reductase
MKTYDIIIIGSGGGSKLRPAADLGKKVAIIEKDYLGGTCLNRGCIPSKMLIHTADVAEEIREAGKFNIVGDLNFKVDFNPLTNRVSQSVGDTSRGIADYYAKEENVDYFHGEARFVENKVIEVNGEKLTAETIVIGVGTRPAIPPIEGLEGTPYLTSTEAIHNHDQQPKKMIVVGAGYIATELGYFYGATGTDVHFLVRSRMLKNEDSEVAAEFTRAFSERFNVHMGVSPTKVAHKDGIFTVHTKDKEGNESTMEADALFIATGITPNSDTLDLQNTDIETNEKGYIKVDDKLQTKVPGVYALGDVVGNYLFRHSVNFEGEYLLEALFTNPNDKPIDYPPMPHAVFTRPQIAGVGKTEDQLKEEGLEADKDYIIGLNSYQKSAMGGDALQSDYGFCKLLFDKQSKKLLGAHIIGYEASTLIHQFIYAITFGGTLDDLLHMIYIHPALPEICRNACRNARSKLD